MSDPSRNMGPGTGPISKGLAPAPTPSPDACESNSIFLNIKSIVKTEIEYFPATGTMHPEEDIKGWVYNQNTTQNSTNVRERVETSVGGVTTNLDEGQTYSTWQSVKTAGLSLKSVSDVKTKRIVNIESGEYSVFNKTKKLYTNESSSTVLKEPEVELPLNTTRYSVTLFKRDSYYNNIPYKEWRYISSEESLDVLTYQVSEGEAFTLSFSENFYTKSIKANTYDGGRGNLSVGKTDAECMSEFKGYGNNSSRAIYTNYFPIKKESVVLFYEREDRYDVIQNIDNYDYDRIEDFDEAKYSVDESRGIITTTGYVSPELRIKSYEEDIKALNVYESTSSFPTEGFLTITVDDKTEYLKYTEKNNYQFLNISRGLFDSEVIANIENEKVRYKSKGSAIPLNSKIYIGYVAVPRIDFEVNLNNKELDFTDLNFNMKPQLFLKQNGILSLSYTEKHLSFIELNISKDLVRGTENVYGPLSIGYDSALLEANLYDSRGNPVDETLVTFKSLENFINFEGDSFSVTNISNNEGVARSIAFVNYNENKIKSSFINSEIFGNDIDGNTLYQVTINEALSNDIQPLDIFVFEKMLIEDGIEEERLIYKFDPSRGEGEKYVPLQPLRIISETNRTNFIFDNSFDSNGNERITGYTIYFSKIANIYCEAVDPATGRVIFSNTIKVKLDLPKALKGAYITDGQLKAVGFGFLNLDDEESVYGTGLGGANFITINPDPSSTSRFNFIVDNNSPE